jgi:hypothetical protein
MAVALGAAAAYLADMQQRTPSLLTIAGMAALLAILAAAVWFVAHAWLSVAGPPMPPAGYAAMILGVAFSLISAAD